MKKFSKILSVALLVALVLSLGVTSAFAAAQTKAYTGEDGDGAKISIGNAAKGETYSVVKLFDATIANDATKAIAYQGNIPSALEGIFEKNTTTGEITAKASAVNEESGNLTAAASATLKSWAEGQTALISETSDGSTPLEFTNLPYGYYVVLTTQGAGAVTVTSTNPDASVVDKNTSEPNIQKKVKNAAGEWVEVTDADIGVAKEFKLDITTANWHEPYGGGEQKQIKQYIIGEDFDTNKFELVSIDSIQVITVSTTTEDETTTTTEAVVDTLTVDQNATFPVTVSWVGTNGASKYPNGAIIRIIYKAKLQEDAVVDVGNTNPDLRGNVNTGDLDWRYTDDTPHFGEGHDHLKDTASVDTYAIALKKFDKNGKSLAGAVFQFPFYVKADANGVAKAEENGNYVYAGTTADTGLTNQITTPEDGQITVVGVKGGTYSIEEITPPDGYNKLAQPVSVTAVKISETTTVTTTERSWKIDQDGKIYDMTEEVANAKTTTYTNNTVAATVIGVINLQGTQLPSTGGIGTTIFYVVGGVLVLAAIILLVTKKRMSE